VLEPINLELGDTQVFALARPGPSPVVFVHGLAASSAYFDDAGGRPELAGRGIVALDLPGFGRSAAPPGFGFTMAEYVEVVLGAVRVLGLREPTLVGHSMGGTVCVLAGEALGGSLDALFAAEAKLQPEPDLWIAQLACEPDDAWARTFAGLQRRAEIYVRGSMYRRRPQAIRRAAPALRQTTARALQASAQSLLATASDPAFYGRYLALRRPSRYIFGDQNVSASLYARLRADGAAITVVPRAGHLMMLDNPEGFYGAIAAGPTEAK
jgi:pimeloyl-ACP methyl ester carboxylesterase